MLEFIQKLRKVRQLKSTGKDEKIPIKVNGEIILLNSDDIYYVQGNKNYSDFYCKGEKEKFVCHKAQGGIRRSEELLKSNVFVKCHNSYIVNTTKIVKIGTFENFFFDLNDTVHVANYSPTYAAQLRKLGVLIK